jgi:hypothetical protein
MTMITLLKTLRTSSGELGESLGTLTDGAIGKLNGAVTISNVLWLNVFRM